MWYIVDLLFAAAKPNEQNQYACETCNVLFEAESALEAYKKGTIWAKKHSETGNLKFFGIEYLREIQEERPNDGDELAGMFFEEEDNIWENKQNIIPDLADIPAIKLENSQDIPLNELLTEQQISILHQIIEEN